MNAAVFEDLIINAVEHPDKTVCCELAKQLETAETPMPELSPPYRKGKEYRYGKVKICLYTKESRL